MVRFLARWLWPLVEGRVIDKRHIKRILIRYDATSQLASVDEYLVEFTHADGQKKRVRITAKSVHLPFTGVPVGSTVPIHVNRRGTRAVFGRFESKEARSERKRLAREQAERDKARFDAKMRWEHED